MEECKITHMPHHMQQKLCQTRLFYRQGKKLTAVKVYTINDESQHLLICGIPKLKLTEEVKKLVYAYGKVKTIQIVTEYPSEEFTETYHVHFEHIQNARIAKRFIDNKNFFGGLLHVFYVPELETLSETKEKLIQRRKDVATRIRKNQQDLMNSGINKFISRIPQNIDPQPASESSVLVNWNSNYNNTMSGSNLLPTPYQSTETVMQTTPELSNRNPEQKVYRKRNYKGKCIGDNVQVKIVQPRLIDTRNIARMNTAKEINKFCNVKKVESGITVKLLEKSDNKRKKIIIRNPNVTSLVQPNQDLQHSIQIAKSQIRTTMQKILK